MAMSTTGRGVVQITASSNSSVAPIVVDFGVKETSFISEDKPGERICFDFKTLRIEPAHYTIKSASLKSWAVEGSDYGAVWMEIDRGENNSDFIGRDAVKTFAVSRSGSFGRICLRQTGPNHCGSNCLALEVFELFGRIVGLQ
jgi:hypothetical protein